MRQMLERIVDQSYTATPIINKHGNLVGIFTEGDLLWTLKNNMNKIPLKELKN